MDITRAQAVDEALCVGWIDGVIHRVDERSYMARFTPRKKSSVWSAVHIARVAVLTAENRLRPARLAAFAARQEDRSGIYSYEQRRDQFGPPHETLFNQHPAAWDFCLDQPPGYRRKVIWMVVIAKQETTRLKRLQQLIAASARGQRIWT